MKTNANYQIQIISSPRWKNIQVITFDNGDIWIDMNDLCRVCRTTTISALNSMRSQKQHVHYFPCDSDENSPFIDINGLECANFFRSNSYINQIADWIELELKNPPLPTPDQIILLQPQKAKPTTNINLSSITQKTPKNAPKKHHNNHPCDDFEPYDHNCNITELTQLYSDAGINYSPKQFLTWLMGHEYINRTAPHRYRPRKRSYNRGYFVDNHRTFNSYYPQRDLKFTPKGQQYFYNKLKAGK